MKYLLSLFLCTAMCLASCVSKKVAEQTENQRDSLQVVVVAKDSLLNAVFADINAISENLSQIKSREHLLAVEETPEGGRRPIDAINRDIAAIDRLLAENREKIASLQYTASQLRKANLRIDELEKTIVLLNTELGEKSAEIQQLRHELTQRTVEVQELTQQVADVQEKMEHMHNERVDLENQLHTVYYIVGAEKELRDAQILNKQGFIGRTLTVNGGSNLDSFTQADARFVSEIPIGRKRAKLVTPHPEGSYQLIVDGDKIVTKLVIDHPERFWENSKILVISYK